MSARARSIRSLAKLIEARVDGRRWADLGAELDTRGFACAPGLLASSECSDLVALDDDAARFRSRVVVSRHGFGRGEYQCFAHPLTMGVIFHDAS